MNQSNKASVRIKVVGLGGAGGNAVQRMANTGLRGLEYFAINTDVQALSRIKGVTTSAIGPKATGGMGSGGNADVGRKAVRESHDQVAQLLEGSDLVFLTAGMGGGTGTGAASSVAEIARREGALTVAVVTRPFSFEGPRRQWVADGGLEHLAQKVDTLIVVQNDRLLPSLGGKISLEAAFRLADEVLRQGVQGISEIVTVPGLINVDFADVRTVIANGGPSYMAVGEGKGKSAAADAARMALANPLFDAPMEGANGVLFNVKGGNDLALGQVHEVAEIIKGASSAEANVIFGVVQDRKWKKRVSITLVATGLKPTPDRSPHADTRDGVAATKPQEVREPAQKAATNGHDPTADSAVHAMF